MFESCLQKQEDVKNLFSRCSSEEEKYEKIIEMGRDNPPIDENLKIESNLVSGCQSRMYLHSEYADGKVYFKGESDALVSSGLGSILIRVYSGESPEVILKCPPNYLEELGISASLSPGRANGLFSIHLKMKQEALKYLLKK